MSKKTTFARLPQAQFFDSRRHFLRPARSSFFFMPNNQFIAKISQKMKQNRHFCETPILEASLFWFFPGFFFEAKLSKNVYFIIDRIFSGFGQI